MCNKQTSQKPCRSCSWVLPKWHQRRPRINAELFLPPSGNNVPLSFPTKLVWKETNWETGIFTIIQWYKVQSLLILALPSVKALYGAKTRSTPLQKRLNREPGLSPHACSTHFHPVSCQRIFTNQNLNKMWSYNIIFTIPWIHWKLLSTPTSRKITSPIR